MGTVLHTYQGTENPHLLGLRLDAAYGTIPATYWPTNYGVVDTQTQTLCYDLSVLWHTADCI